jgi:hypothetical protein
MYYLYLKSCTGLSKEIVQGRVCPTCRAHSQCFFWRDGARRELSILGSIENYAQWCPSNVHSGALQKKMVTTKENVEGTDDGKLLACL